MPFSRTQDKPALAAGANLRVSLGLAVIVLFFIGTGLLAAFNINVLREGASKVQHTHTVITSLDALTATLQDAETGQRGYLLTGRQQYLSPYQDAVTRAAIALDRVGTLTRDNPVQQERLVTVRRHVEAKLAELKETVDLRRSGDTSRALALVETDRGKADMDAIREQLQLMRQEEGRLRRLRIDEMDAAYRTAWLTGIVTGALGIALTLAVGFLLRRGNAARERLQWQQAGQARLAEAMLGDLNEAELGANVLAFLAAYLGAKGGAIYAGKGASFGLIATQGVPGDARIVERFVPSEGLLGQAAADRSAIQLSDVPDGYLTIGSAFGQDKPRHLIIVPAIADNLVQGVFELGFFQPVADHVVEFLGPASASIGIALRSARFRAELQALLEETQRQSEELQAQSEELRVSNEELEEQGRALKESQVRLEQQQVELEQTNAQLEEQAQQLEGQRDDLVRSNAAVELKARELDRASQYKSDFLANMSHELRTPLNSLLILSKLLGDNPAGNLTEEQVKYAQTIHGSGSDLLLLINDILDLSKIEAGHVEVRPEAVSLQRLASDMRQLFEPLAKERGLDLAVTLAEEVPDTIETDRQRLDQILKNLLSNALKFTEAGGVSLAIAPAADGRLSLSVTDSGIGIAPDQQHEIFEAFRQADGTISRRYGGTGLGLSISRELARLLGGSITLSSTPGEGSTFTLVIPAAYDPAVLPQRAEPLSARPTAGLAQEVPPPVPAPPPPSSAGPLARPVDDDRDDLASGDRVLLVVEDDSSFAAIVRDLAREMGFRCLVAGRAEEALDLARRFKPSAVVLDVGLPDQSGLAVLDRLKSEVQTRHIPIHVVSANDHTQTALSLGAIGYLVKPVKREDLAGVLEALAAKLSQTARRVLIVEDDAVQRDAVARLLATGDVDTVAVGTAAECLERLRTEEFDCMVLDLTLPDASGFTLLEQIHADASHGFPPVIVYTGRDLSADEEQRLRRYSDSIIIKGARSPERLLDEVSLFLHQIVTDLPPEQQKMIQQARNRDAILEGRRILVVEDDVRNVYSLTNVLEPRGAQVSIARNGREAIEALDRSAEANGEAIDLVLMDVMMPVMDGLAATQEIRANPRWQKLPIIALTAKAMPDDQRRCIEAGASDYMAKPLDVDKLLSLVRVWMPR